MSHTKFLAGAMLVLSTMTVQGMIVAGPKRNELVCFLPFNMENKDEPFGKLVKEIFGDKKVYAGLGTSLVAVGTGVALDFDTVYGGDIAGHVIAMILVVVGFFILGAVIFSRNDGANNYNLRFAKFGAWGLVGLGAMTCSGISGVLSIALIPATNSQSVPHLCVIVMLLLLVLTAICYRLNDYDHTQKVIHHVIGSVCLVAGTVLMSHLITVTHSVKLGDAEGGIFHVGFAGWLVLVFLLASVGLVWISHLADPINVNRMWKPACMFAGAGFFTGGIAGTAWVNSMAPHQDVSGATVVVAMVFLAGAICVMSPLVLTACQRHHDIEHA